MPDPLRQGYYALDSQKLSLSSSIMKKTLQIGLIILLGIIFYFNSLFNGFIWDDEYLVEKNPHIRSLVTALPYAFSHDIFPGEILTKESNYYRPLQSLSYATDYFFWRDSPFGFHLTNLALHIGNAILIYLVISCLCSIPFVSFISALFFMAHPVHHSAVSYISGRADLLAAFFILLSFLCFLKYRLKGMTKKVKPYFLLSLLFFFLALLSKEYALILPLLFLTFDIIFKKIKRENLSQHLCFLVPIYIYSMLRMGALGYHNWFLGGKYFFLLREEFSVRVFTFLKTIPFYLGILILPLNLHMQRSFPKPESFLDPGVWGSLIFLFVCFFVCFKKRSQGSPLALFLFFWFIFFIFFQSYVFLAGFSFAEHFLYLASMSFFFVLASTFAYFFNRFKARPQERKFIWLLFSILIIFYGSLTSIHNLNWKNNLTFFKWTLRFSPQSIKARINLGNAYTSIGRDNLALIEYEKARELLGYVSVQRYKDKAVMEGKLNRAIADMHYNLGVVSADRKNYPRAEVEYRQALALEANFHLARNNLAAVLTKLNRSSEAIAQLEIILEQNPQNLDAYYNLGAIYANRGEDKKAEEFWLKGLSLDSEEPRIRFSLERLKE